VVLAHYDRMISSLTKIKQVLVSRTQQEFNPNNHELSLYIATVMEDPKGQRKSALTVLSTSPFPSPVPLQV